MKLCILLNSLRRHPIFNLTFTTLTTDWRVSQRQSLLLASSWEPYGYPRTLVSSFIIYLHLRCRATWWNKFTDNLHHLDYGSHFGSRFV